MQLSRTWTRTRIFIFRSPILLSVSPPKIGLVKSQVLNTSFWTRDTSGQSDKRLFQKFGEGNGPMAREYYELNQWMKPFKRCSARLWENRQQYWMLTAKGKLLSDVLSNKTDFWRRTILGSEFSKNRIPLFIIVQNSSHLGYFDCCGSNFSKYSSTSAVVKLCLGLHSMKMFCIVHEDFNTRVCTKT